MKDGFETDVQTWIINAIQRGVSSFEDLIHSLPGVYPAVALEALIGLAESRRFDGANFRRLVLEATTTRIRVPEATVAQLPAPHPLDFSWWFDSATTHKLCDLTLSLVGNDDSIILLGTPRLFVELSALEPHRNLLLLDADRLVATRLTSGHPCQAIQIFDVMRDPLPQCRGELVIADPPWYEDEICSFLWSASFLVNVGGNIIMTLPTLGTRPGVLTERDRILNWAIHLGLKPRNLEESALAYMSPPFEINALVASGIRNVPLNWRRGAFAIFEKTQPTSSPRPSSPPAERWKEETIGDVRIRVRNAERNAWGSPLLQPLVTGDILPSVSRRDPRRDLVDVWTSGNRVFQCAGGFVLTSILAAMAVGSSAQSAVLPALERPLTNNETEQVSSAVRAIEELVLTESLELEEKCVIH